MISFTKVFYWCKNSTRSSFISHLRGVNTLQWMPQYGLKWSEVIAIDDFTWKLPFQIWWGQRNREQAGRSCLTPIKLLGGARVGGESWNTRWSQSRHAHQRAPHPGLFVSRHFTLLSCDTVETGDYRVYIYMNTYLETGLLPYNVQVITPWFPLNLYLRPLPWYQTILHADTWNNTIQWEPSVNDNLISDKPINTFRTNQNWPC